MLGTVDFEEMGQGIDLSISFSVSRWSMLLQVALYHTKAKSEPFSHLEKTRLVQATGGRLVSYLRR
jgi:hypothetical protein